MPFVATILRWPGHTVWYVRVPMDQAPPVTHPWGRSPVWATIGGYRWDTSVWRSKKEGAILLVPVKARGHRGLGEEVDVALEPKPIVGNMPARRRS